MDKEDLEEEEYDINKPWEAPKPLPDTSEDSDAIMRKNDMYSKGYGV